MTAHNIADLPIVLPLHVVPMLRDDGIVTLEDWTALGEKRHKIFGITRESALALDRAIAEMLETLK